MIDFHAKQNCLTYAGRQADPSWFAEISKHLSPMGKSVLDMGCGGGIYTRAWNDLNAKQVIGIDFSQEAVSTARKLTEHDIVGFAVGDVLNIPVADDAVDIVYPHALIHHVTNLGQYLQETARTLVSGGVCLVQNRTFEDVCQPGSEPHLRGFIFELFPHLLEKEETRRHSKTAVIDTMKQVGFASVQTTSFWETRRIYDGFDEYAADLSTRTGRSLLYHLSDRELTELIDFVSLKIAKNQRIIEQDRWTLWRGIKRPLSG